MTIRHMKIFVVVYQTGSITRAAEQLHMTQPSVSRAVQEMERYYGVQLFDRIGRRISVTECGKRFYAQALHIADSFESMEKGLRNWDELGVLRVGATITLGTVLLPRAIAEFQQSHPKLRIEATVSNGASLEQALAENELDLALIEGSVSDAHLVAEPFTQDRLVLILPPSDALLQKESLCMNDLRERPLLLRDKGSVGRAFLSHVFAVHGIPLAPLWESTSTHALIQAVHRGLGIAILPELLVSASIEDGSVATRTIEDEAFQRSNYIVHHECKALSRSAECFVEVCRSCVLNSMP